MTRIFLSVLALLTFWSPLSHAKELNFYLPSEAYTASIPSPEQTLGYTVGSWHVRHDQLVSYFKALAASSPRVSIKTIGYTHQQRELIQVYIASEQNQSRLTEIQRQHIANLTGKNAPNASDTPLVVNLNYSVHGDEPSGSNASMLVAYYLAASNSPEVQSYLDNMVIIIDPSLNPDGLSRFAEWANGNKGMNHNADPEHREHIQDWVRGRVNHYWFDLNRDWLLLQHPESRARIEAFHAWRPNVLTDHHEMGTHSTFFFQPGIPSRKNPFTPTKNVELTAAIANHHAEAFDSQNVLYFTEEAFDDFYSGKGSTYPDLHGAVGILFEQGSSRGHSQESINGVVEFPQTIKNQVTASFSTLKGALANKQALLSFQYQSANDYKKLAAEQDFAGFVVAADQDTTRFNNWLAILDQHNIEYQWLTKNATVNGEDYLAERAVFVPLMQPQYRLVQSIFSVQTRFNDNTFYDVSSWNLAMAFNLPFNKVKSQRSLKVSANKPNTIGNSEMLAAGAYSYAIEWHDSQAPKLVYDLLKKGLSLRATNGPVSATLTTGEVKEFAAGTMFVHAGLQQPGWFTQLQDSAAKVTLPIWPIGSGLTPAGLDLGSRNMIPVTKPEVLIVGGQGASPYEVGEIWYLFDRDIGFSPTIIERQRLASVDLERYTHIVLVDGQYGMKDDALAAKFNAWVKRGGTLWGQRRAALWLAKQNLIAADIKDTDDIKQQFSTEQLSYGDQEEWQGRQRIAGAFFETKLDNSHPLTFGMERGSLPVFKVGLHLLKANKPFTQVAGYSPTPLLSGFTDPINESAIANTSAILAQQQGDGHVVAMTDNATFRAITHGSARILINSLFLADMIETN